MKVLAIDTAMESCSVALALGDQVIERYHEEERSAERVLALVDEALRAGAVELEALRAIAFGRGPGAFTGVRLAASVTQGLAFGASLGVVPVSDLAAIAQRAFDSDPALRRVVVCSDARMREVYWGCYERGGATGLAELTGTESVGKPEAVALPAHWSPRDCHGVGTGFAVYPALQQLLAADRIWGEPLGRLLPRAREVLRLALPEVRAGRLVPPEAAVPVYLRNEVAWARSP